MGLCNCVGSSLLESFKIKLVENFGVKFVFCLRAFGSFVTFDFFLLCS
jgi:hypothetical protein